MRPLAPYTPDSVAREATRSDYAQRRLEVFGGEAKLPENQPPKHGDPDNQALHDLFCKYPQALLFGEDVAQKGGVYTVTKGLHKAFRNKRVFNTLLDETIILGLAQGYANMGMLPIRKSSIWPISTTPATRFVARPPPCSFSPTTSMPTRWWCALPDWVTRRALAAISTTTTR